MKQKELEKHLKAESKPWTKKDKKDIARYIKTYNKYKRSEGVDGWDKFFRIVHRTYGKKKEAYKLDQNLRTMKARLKTEKELGYPPSRLKMLKKGLLDLENRAKKMDGQKETKQDLKGGKVVTLTHLTGDWAADLQEGEKSQRQTAQAQAQGQNGQGQGI